MKFTTSPSDDANPNQPNQLPNAANGNRNKSPSIPGGGKPPPADLEALWNKHAPVIMPRGRYNARIIGTELKTYGTGTECYLISFQIAEGKFCGKGLSYQLWLTDAAMPWTQYLLGKFGMYRLQDLYHVNIVGAWCSVIVETVYGRDGRPKSQINDFTPIETPYIEDDDGGQEGGDHSDGE